VIGLFGLTVSLLVGQKWLRSTVVWTKFWLVRKTGVLVDKNIYVLIRKRGQLRWRDEYGKMQDGRWQKEVSKFVRENLVSTLGINEQRALSRHMPLLLKVVENRVSRATKKISATPRQFSNSMTPIDFEAYCAEQLSASGWTAHVTNGSHDQGVDIVAEKGGKRIVLQCKLYSSPVGNSAVQEIVAGKLHEKADDAIVVTNSSYTPSARQLANTTGVLLLHHDQLRKLESLLPAARR
jgi:restriction system protein